MEFRPPRTLGSLVGGGLAAWCFAITTALVIRGVMLDVSLGVIALYVVATIFFFMGLLFAYWTYSLGTLRYTLDRNALTIIWGDIRQMVPMSQIERLVPGRELHSPHVAGVSWLGHHVGHARVDGGIGDTIFYSTHQSASDLLGSLTAVPQAPERLYLAAQPFWEDRAAQALAFAAFATFFAMFAYVYDQYPGLPASMALSFPHLNGVTRVASKSELLKLPMTGVGLLLLNLGLGFIAHSWERMVGYVLLLAAIGAEGILLAAAIIALR
jgi:hypothetical protein